MKNVIPFTSKAAAKDPDVFVGIVNHLQYTAAAEASRAAASAEAKQQAIDTLRAEERAQTRRKVFRASMATVELIICLLACIGATYVAQIIW